MKGRMPVLNIHMLGGFSVVYGEKPISFGRNSTTKAMKLLKLLIYNGRKGIARERLLEEMYGNEELADRANNLRVAVYRMKKLLADAGLPQYDYVVIKKGIYYWDSPMNVVIDAKEFDLMIREADVVSDATQRISLLQKACRIYSGDFLPELSADGFTLSEQVRLKNLYSKALEEVCAYHMEKGEFEEALTYCEKASKLYPFDEWQSVEIDCLIAMNRFSEAMDEYDATAKLLFEELGVMPSDKMLNQFKRMSNKSDRMPERIKEIKKQLQETERMGGAFYCTLPSFRDSYRLLSRIIERNGLSVFLMMCNIVDENNRPMEKGRNLDKRAKALDKAIGASLRRGDCYTKFSVSQYLILLVGTNQEDCEMIFERIKRKFVRNHPSWEKNLTYSVTSVAELNKRESLLKFDNRKIVWN